MKHEATPLRRLSFVGGRRTSSELSAEDAEVLLRKSLLEGGRVGSVGSRGHHGGSILAVRWGSRNAISSAFTNYAVGYEKGSEWSNLAGHDRETFIFTSSKRMGGGERSFLQQRLEREGATVHYIHLGTDNYAHVHADRDSQTVTVDIMEGRNIKPFQP